MKTPISYYGGKQTLLKHILPLIPDHKLYTEAFCGGCAVLFAKAPAECEVINDINTELVNFYKVAKTRYPELKTLVDASLHSREEHAISMSTLLTSPRSSGHGPFGSAPSSASPR